MRLGQLARQLDVKTDDIVAFLASRNIVIEPGNNTKVEDEHLALVMHQFGAQPQTITPAAHPPETEQKPVNPEPAAADPTVAETEELPELIKAPKVELPGLKVLGKIELPEKKKKEEEAPGINAEKPLPAETPRRPGRREERPREKSWKNPLAVQREREEREKERIREEQRAREKQRKTEHYMKRLKPQAPTKAVKLNREEVEEMPQIKYEAPRSLWGKMMAWLNGR